MGGDGHGVDHLGDVGRSADGLELAGLLEPLDQERGVDPLAGVVHGHDVAVELAVGVGVEVVGAEDQDHVVAEVAGRG